MRLFKRKEFIALDPDMERRKRLSIDAHNTRARMRQESDDAQRAREKVCGASQLGHVYELSKTVCTRPSTYECVGCGKTTSRRY
jgi:hypothetical protein